LIKGTRKVGEFSLANDKKMRSPLTVGPEVQSRDREYLFVLVSSIKGAANPFLEQFDSLLEKQTK
jgi:hypothetical protein